MPILVVMLQNKQRVGTASKLLIAFVPNHNDLLCNDTTCFSLSEPGLSQFHIKRIRGLASVLAGSLARFTLVDQCVQESFSNVGWQALLGPRAS
jgi:hypothetical protein